MEMDYEERLSRVREAMRKKRIALMYLRRGANLFYLTGIKRRRPELTDSNSYGDYIHGAYISMTGGITLVAPRMGGSDWQKEAENKPWITEVKILDESERPKLVLRQVLSAYNLRGKSVAIEERAWAHTVLLFREALPYSRLINANEIIEPMRMIKDDNEITVMKKAGEITDRVYGKVIDRIERGMTEIEIANTIDFEFRKQGAEYNSFVTSVRFRSPKHPWSMTGSTTKPRTLEDGDSVTFDFGCVYEGYCSDFGRTVFVGDPPARVREIHDLVMISQAEAILQMRAGKLTCEQLDRVARGIIERAGYGENFIHRLGHGIGITVHEPPYLYLPDDTMLNEGMTFTIEPSIVLFNEWSARVEDVVMVTNNGGVPFSNYHKELTVI
jgi:Xaa-Pro dipeptidase